MPEHKHTTRTTTSGPDSGGLTDPGGSGLQAQARKYGSAARKIRANSKTEEEAAEELSRRRNQSGQ